jgi:2-iminobutanoate/2-iminopropanoate deaminase
MNSVSQSRRRFAWHAGWLLAAVGLVKTTCAGGSSSAADGQEEVRKLDYEGKPANGKQMITSLIVHNGLIYISGQGANDAGNVQGADIESHTKKVMDNVKKLVEAGGGSMDSILQLTVYLANLDYYDGMNKVFKGYFPNGGPARTTVAVAGVPGRSLLEINCIAAVTRH